MTRQHTAMNHSKSYEALKKIVQEFANNSTTSQADASLAAISGRDVRGQLGRWCYQRHGFTTVGGPAKDMVTYHGTVPMAWAKARTTSARAGAHTNGAIEHARVLSSLREAPPKHAGPQRVPRELRRKFMTWADMNGNCKGGHQQVEGEILAHPGLQAEGQDGEREVKVITRNQKSQKSRGSENRQDGRLHRVPRLHECRNPH